jgi:hypothetical protein
MTSAPMMPILRAVETPEFVDPEQPERERRPPPRRVPRPPVALPRPGAGIWGAGDRMGTIAGIILAISAFTDWYAGQSPLEGPTLAVIAWHTGALGKLVFFIGLAVILLSVLRELGVELPPAIPDSLVTLALGALATVFVLIRLISIPDQFAGTAGRGIGIWISLLAALAVILAGLLRAGEEL